MINPDIAKKGYPTNRAKFTCSFVLQAKVRSAEINFYPAIYLQDTTLSSSPRIPGYVNRRKNMAALKIWYLLNFFLRILM